MKRYYQYKVKLKSGIEFQAKVDGEHLGPFEEWINSVPNVSNAEMIRSVNKIGPHSSQKTKLAIARMAAGITQQEMADRLGIGLASYQRWEYAQFKPKTKTLMAIGEILDVDWTTLIE